MRRLINPDKVPTQLQLMQQQQVCGWRRCYSCSQAVVGLSPSPKGSIGGGLQSRHSSSLRKKTAPPCHVASQLMADFTGSKSDKGQKEGAWPEGRKGEQNSGGKWEWFTHNRVSNWARRGPFLLFLCGVSKCKTMTIISNEKSITLITFNFKLFFINEWHS